MKLKLSFTVLLVSFISVFSFAQNKQEIDKTIQLNKVASKLEAKQYDMTKANRPEQIHINPIANNSTGVNYSTRNNDEDIIAFARIEGEQWGTLNNIEDNNLVYFSSEWIGNNLEVKTYDEEFNTEESFVVAIPESANRVEVLNHYSSNFFTNDSSKELMVYVHYFDDEIPGAAGQISEVWVVESNGDIIAKLEGNAAWAKFDNQNNKRLYSYFLDAYEGGVISEYDLVDFDTINTYTIDEDVLNYFMGIPFDFMNIDNEEYLIVSHYESEFMDNATMEVYPDNHLIVKILDYDFDEVKSMSFDIDSNFDSGPFLIPMAEFGTFFAGKDKNFNISSDIFNSDTDLEVVYGIYYYDMMADSEWSTFIVANEDGDIIHELNEYILGINWDILSIDGEDTQIGLLLSDDGFEATQLGFFDVESWEMAATFDAMQGDDLLSDKFNRIPHEDTYHYLIGIASPDEENGNTYGVVNEYTIGGDLHKRHQFYVPNDVELFEPLLNSNVLTPNIFTTESDDLYFMYVYLEKIEDNSIINNIVIASDAENILAEFRGDGEDGNIVGAGLVLGVDGDIYDKLSLQYEANLNSLYIDFYKLPFGETLGVEDFENISFAIYPNPSSNIIKVEANVLAKEIKVYDMAGNLVVNQPLNDFQSTINISNVTNGVYIAHVTLEDGSTQIVKLIKN